MARTLQQNLFADGSQPELLEPPAALPRYRPDIDDVRARLYKILGEARAAAKLPWDRDKFLVYRNIFPQMTLWLPDEEGSQLRLEFAAEIARLEAA